MTDICVKLAKLHGECVLKKLSHTLYHECILFYRELWHFFAKRIKIESRSTHKKSNDKIAVGAVKM